VIAQGYAQSPEGGKDSSEFDSHMQAHSLTALALERGL